MYTKQKFLKHVRVFKKLRTANSILVMRVAVSWNIYDCNIVRRKDEEEEEEAENDW